jgi:hypothetical protein
MSGPQRVVDYYRRIDDEAERYRDKQMDEPKRDEGEEQACIMEELDGLQQFAHSDPIIPRGTYMVDTCHYCKGDNARSQDVQHKPSCIWVEANKFLNWQPPTSS